MINFLNESKRHSIHHTLKKSSKPYQIYIKSLQVIHMSWAIPSILSTSTLIQPTSGPPWHKLRPGACSWDVRVAWQGHPIRRVVFQLLIFSGYIKLEYLFLGENNTYQKMARKGASYSLEKKTCSFQYLGGLSLEGIRKLVYSIPFMNKMCINILH